MALLVLVLLLWKYYCSASKSELLIGTGNVGWSYVLLEIGIAPRCFKGKWWLCLHKNTGDVGHVNFRNIKVSLDMYCYFVVCSIMVSSRSVTRRKRTTDVAHSPTLLMSSSGCVSSSEQISSKKQETDWNRMRMTVWLQRYGYEATGKTCMQDWHE